MYSATASLGIVHPRLDSAELAHICIGVLQIWSSGKPPGVVRSPLQPEETRGLTRSDDLSRMLPFEAHLMAAGWPKNDIDEAGNEVVKEGSRPARLLHMVRRAERNLMSYERTGMLLTLCFVQYTLLLRLQWSRCSLWD